ncbi:MAG: hypothetical protein RI920_886 [Pseudomonadota bacterium]
MRPCRRPGGLAPGEPTDGCRAGRCPRPGWRASPHARRAPARTDRGGVAVSRPSGTLPQSFSKCRQQCASSCAAMASTTAPTRRGSMRSSVACASGLPRMDSTSLQRPATKAMPIGASPGVGDGRTTMSSGRACSCAKASTGAAAASHWRSVAVSSAASAVIPARAPHSPSAHFHRSSWPRGGGGRGERAGQGAGRFTSPAPSIPGDRRDGGPAASETGARFPRWGGR